MSVTLEADGSLLVTDAWSGRLLRFGPGPDAAYAGEIRTGWTSRDVLHKPYVAVLTDGRILVSYPEAGRLVLFTAAGEQIGAWQPLQSSVPVGVVATQDGGFAFSDVGLDHVQIIPAALVESLFE